MKNFRILALTVAVVFACTGLAVAGSFGPSGSGINWSSGGGTTVWDLLDPSNGFFNGHNEIDPDDGYNFQGPWDYTAIAYEAGHNNVVRAGTPINDQMDYQFSNNDVTGSDPEYLAFGDWDRVVFGDDNEGNPPSDNLRFKDASDDAPKPLLDPYPNTLWPGQNTKQYLKLFELTEDSNELDWLGDMILGKGTMIVGFNDNFSGGDSDFDDIIVAMKPVPEPGTILLLGAGLMGLAGLRRKMKK